MRDITSKKIIVVEDEADIRLLYKEILNGAGYYVEAIADGITGLNRLMHEEWDLLLLDIMLPGKDGLKILKEICGTPGNKKGCIVALSNLNSENIIKEAFLNGIDGYLIKSEITPDKLVEEIKGFLEKK